jgi:hypothetical protein
MQKRAILSDDSFSFWQMPVVRTQNSVGQFPGEIPFRARGKTITLISLESKVRQIGIWLNSFLF